MAAAQNVSMMTVGSIWYAGSVLASLLGMATKEVMVSAPLVVLLYDRTFLAGSFRDAWRRRWGYYLALTATWLLLAWLVAGTGLLVRSLGERQPGVHWFRWWDYLATQQGVIVHYLRLVIWPSGLCLDYSWPAATMVVTVLFPAVLVVCLLALTVWALVRRPAWGFLGACFFLILAPTSSFFARAGHRGFRAPHVPAAGGSRRRRRGRRMPCGPAAGTPRDDPASPCLTSVE